MAHRTADRLISLASSFELIVGFLHVGPTKSLTFSRVFPKGCHEMMSIFEFLQLCSTFPVFNAFLFFSPCKKWRSSVIFLGESRSKMDANCDVYIGGGEPWFYAGTCHWLWVLGFLFLGWFPRVSGWVRDRNDRDRKLLWLISPTYRTNNNQLI